MKRIIHAVAAVTFLLSCETPKTAVEVTQPTENRAEEENDGNKSEERFATGQVRLNLDGCPIVVILENSGMKLYPVGLEEMFQVDNAWLQFKFEPSRAPQPEGCPDARPTVLTNIVRLKR